MPSLGSAPAENLKKYRRLGVSTADGKHPLNMNDSAGLTNHHPGLEGRQNRI